MGKDWLDKDSIGHFLFGIIGSVVFFRNNPILSLIIMNSGHLIMELLEKEYNPKTGEILKTTKNHIADIILYFIGSLIGLLIKNSKYLNTTKLFILGVVYVLVTIHQFGRELFPDTWIYNPAYST